VGEPRFFFHHVMKTGGSTFRRHIAANFKLYEVYPNRVDDGPGAYWKVDEVTALDPERHARTRIYSGHLPLFVSALVPHDDVVTMTILRDPVERTISLLTREQQLKQPERSLEEIYGDRLYFARFVRNHMTKFFSLSAADKAQTYFAIQPTGAEHLAVARERLAAVDVVGVQERFGDFLDVLAQTYGWRVTDVDGQKVSTDKPVVAAEFRARIAADNALDVQLYEDARELAARAATKAGVA
jgi:hypothetical protein